MAAFVLVTAAKQAIGGINDGLVAYYPFNGNASDASGHGHDGIVNGAVLTSDRFDLAFKAYYFDGSSTISVADHPDFNFDASQGLTLSTWAYRTASNNPQHLLGKRAGDPYFVQLAVGPGAMSDGLVPLNTWTHLTMTVDTVATNYYMNGQLAQVAGGATFFSDTDVPLLIGSSGSYEHFTGKLDEVRIYNRVLSPAEIEEIAQVVSPPPPPPPPPTSNTYTWHVYHGHGYALTHARQTWAAAEAEAATVNGHLTTINNDGENTFLMTTFDDAASQRGDSIAWIGYLRSTPSSNDWHWSSGEPVTYSRQDYVFWPQGGTKAYIHMAIPGTLQPGTWNANPFHDTDPVAMPYGIIEVIPHAADTNFDGVVDVVDLFSVARHWMNAGDWGDGDFTDDGFVNIDDLRILAQNWGATTQNVSLAAALTSLGLPQIDLPEPGSAFFWACLLTGLQRTRSKRPRCVVRK